MHRFQHARLWLLTLLIVLFIFTLPAGAASKKKTKLSSLQSIRDNSNKNETHVTTIEEGVDGLLIEDNPDYLDDNDLMDGGSDDDDGTSDDDDCENGETTTSAVSKSSKVKKTKKKNSKGPVATLKKHRGSITFAIALIAFRREILALLSSTFRSSRNNFDCIGALKLLLFVDAVRKMQTGGSGLFSSGDGGGSFFSTLTNFMASNPAYLPPVAQHYTFERINEYFVKDAMALNKAIKTRHEGLTWSSPSLPSLTGPGKLTKVLTPKPFSKTSQTAIIVDWTKLDSALTSMKRMREEISFLLSDYRSLAMNDNVSSEDQTGTPDLEVILLLESPGGSVAEYGLAGSLLMQLRDTPGVTLTICVDKVAASGGYMLCCTASPGKLFAAPFAMVGSVGVIGQIINIQDLLTGWGIQPLVFRGGKDKAPVGLIGDITEEGKQRTQEMIDQTHQAFKNHVLTARPVLKEHIAEVGSGNVWLGVHGLRLGLIDEIKTSEEYIGDKLREGVRVLKMVPHRPGVGLGSIFIGSGLETRMKSVMSNMGKAIQSKAQSFGVGQWGLTTSPIDVVATKKSTT